MSFLSSFIKASLLAALAGISATSIVTPVLAEDEDNFTTGLLNMGRSKYHPDDETEAVDGSVVPTMTMEEQVVGCKNTEDETTRILVNVSGIQSDEGNVRVMIYGENPDDFLVSGKGISRVDVPSIVGEMQVCMELPHAGIYSMAVLHDRNANGRVEVFSEGFGFSNNPSLGFSVPDYDDVAFTTGAGLQQMQVALNYIFGEEQTDRRRRSRR